MKRFLIFIFLCAYALTFVVSNTAFSQIAKVKITHSHDHGDGHHHEDSKDKPNSKSPESPGAGGQHSHEVSVGSVTAIAGGDLQVSHASVSTSTDCFSSADQRIPKSPNLLGIFRPPIA